MHSHLLLLTVKDHVTAEDGTSWGQNSTHHESFTGNFSCVVIARAHQLNFKDTCRAVSEPRGGGEGGEGFGGDFHAGGDEVSGGSVVIVKHHRACLIRIETLHHVSRRDKKRRNRTNKFRRDNAHIMLCVAYGYVRPHSLANGHKV